MGYFLATSAFRTNDFDGVVAAVAAYCAKHDAAVKPFTGSEPSPSTDAQFYAPEKGWTTCLWPNYFNIHDFALCSAVAEEMDIDVSTVHVYDGDFWEHLFVKGKDKIHFFCSFPTYFAPEETESVDQSVPREPSALCSHLGIPEDSIARYLRVLPLSEQEAAPPRQGLFSFFRRKPSSAPTEDLKAYPDDEFEIEDFWVFTDFWRKLGITYPDQVHSYKSVLRLDGKFMDKLPSI